VCVCVCVQANPYHFLDFLGITLAFQDYWRDSMNETLYLTQNRFLPQLNNELPAKNGSYKANMVSLNKLVLVEATEDTIVYPYQSEQFGGYEWGTPVRTVQFWLRFPMVRNRIPSIPGHTVQHDRVPDVQERLDWVEDAGHVWSHRHDVVRWRPRPVHARVLGQLHFAVF
jgi:hypothetical protein